jgi:hypothetical protein
LTISLVYEYSFFVIKFGGLALPAGRPDWFLWDNNDADPKFSEYGGYFT